MGSRARSRLELVVLELDAERTKLAGQLRARPRGVVRDETQPVAGLAELATASAPPGIGSPETWRTAVDVQQNRSHGARVYSGHPLGRPAPFGDRAALLALERAGGQHAQKAETRAEAVFDVEASSALTDAQKRRVVTKAGPVLRAVAQDERSQARNRELATERVVEQLREALAQFRGGAGRRSRPPPRENGGSRASAAAPGPNACVARPRTRSLAPWSSTTASCSSCWRS